MKTHRSVFFSLAILMALVVYPGAVAAQETTVAVSFEREQLLFDRARGYDQVHLVDGDVISQVGAPVLPAKQLIVAIPSGAEATQVRVRSVASEELAGTYQIFPGQPPRRLDGSSPPPFVGPDESVYTSVVAYPEELGRLDGQTDLAGQQMALVSVYPLQYVPATGQLILHRELEVTVQSRPGYVSRESYAKFTEKQRAHYEEMLRGMVINPQDVVLDPLMRGASKALPAGDFDHVVITTSSFESYFDDLVEWHNRRGLRDTVVTTAYIYANYSGADDQEKIRNFVIDAHGTWGTNYFLMGGEHGDVPFEYRTYYAGENTPSDNYYADYDDDWTCEVYVGRLSGENQTEFNTAIDKILKYERNPQTSDYPKDILLIGMDLDASTHCELLKEAIVDYIPGGFNINKVYDSDTVPPTHVDSAVTCLNAGQNLVNHADHANWNVLGIGDFNHGWGLYNGGVDALSNDDQPSNVVSTGCYPNQMDHSPTSLDCIGEHFVIYNPNQAGVSFTGNTRDGWFYSGYPQQLSNQLDRDWWRGLFEHGQDNLGKALVWSKHQFDHSSNIEKHCEWTFCLLGEPAMPLWTDTPASLDVTHPGTLPTGSSSFLVHVESGGSDLDSGYVCLWKQGDVYLTDYTNSSGDVTFNPSPATTGTLYVTATKYNYLPYEGTALVTEETPPPVTDLGITLSKNDLVLIWSPPEEKAVIRYVVYRDTLSDFVPAPEDSIGGTSDTTYTDVGAAGTVGTNYYYVVKSVSDSGQKSDPSDTVGEFDKYLVNAPAK